MRILIVAATALLASAFVPVSLATHTPPTDPPPDGWVACDLYTVPDFDLTTMTGAQIINGLSLGVFYVDHRGLNNDFVYFETNNIEGLQPGSAQFENIHYGDTSSGGTSLVSLVTSSIAGVFDAQGAGLYSDPGSEQCAHTGDTLLV